MSRLSSSLTVVEYALPPFEHSPKIFVCECESCRVCCEYRFLLPRLFFGGFLLPLCWILNLALYVYTQKVVNHSLQFPQISDDDYPTLFELDMNRKHTSDDPRLGMKDVVNTPQHSMSASALSTWSLKNTTSTTPDPLDNILLQSRIEFLATVSSDVLTYHSKTAQFYATWALRSAISLLIYTCLLILLIVTLKNARNTVKGHIQA